MLYDVEERFKKCTLSYTMDFSDLLVDSNFEVSVNYIGDNPKVENKEYPIRYDDHITLIRMPEKMNVGCSCNVIEFIVRCSKTKDTLYRF